MTDQPKPLRVHVFPTENIEYFRYVPNTPPEPVALPPYCYLRDMKNDTCYVGRLNQNGDGYHFDGETATVMPNLWEGDNA